MFQRTIIIVLLLYTGTALAREGQGGVAAAHVRSMYAGKTRMTYNSGHGTQIEYVAPNGRNYLWYPGNTTILRGRWRTQTATDGAIYICLLYPSSSYNPVMQTYGGQWECEEGAHALSHTKEVLNGDPFGLARRLRPPFILPRDETTFAALRRSTIGR